MCLEPLAPDAAVWHCSGGAASPGSGCFCVVHLLCTQAWARSQQADAAARAAALAAAPPDLCASFPDFARYLLHYALLGCMHAILLRMCVFSVHAISVLP